MIDTLHHAALAGRERSAAAAREVIEAARLESDNTLMTALEALLNVLPPPSGGAGAGAKKDEAVAGAMSDFEALERLRRLAFAEEVPAPQGVQTVMFASAE